MTLAKLYLEALNNEEIKTYGIGKGKDYKGEKVFFGWDDWNGEKVYTMGLERPTVDKGLTTQLHNELKEMGNK